MTFGSGIGCEKDLCDTELMLESGVSNVQEKRKNNESMRRHVATGNRRRELIMSIVLNVAMIALAMIVLAKR